MKMRSIARIRNVAGHLCAGREKYLLPGLQIVHWPAIGTADKKKFLAVLKALPKAALVSQPFS